MYDVEKDNLSMSRRCHVVLTIVVSVMSTVWCSAQVSRYVYREVADSTRNCYLVVLPDGPPVGLVVRDYSRLPDAAVASPFRFTDLMIEAGWAVLYTATSTADPDLYYTDEGPALLDSIIHEVVQAHHLDPHRIVVGGISASGTRALRYAQWCARGRSPFGHHVAGVFAVDPPLDLERFYRSAKRIIERNDPRSNLYESQLMVNVLPQQLGGSPDDVPSGYHQASVYARHATDGGNAGLLRDIPVRFYHEPDVDWWVQERAADRFDFNSIDIEGCVQQVRDLGGSTMELITTTGKGFDRDGKRKPHSWTIVDEPELVQWITHLAPSR
jgi:hypothetical protein